MSKYAKKRTLDDSDGSEPVITKKVKKSENAKAAPFEGEEDGNKFWRLSQNRRVTIQKFSGKTLINLREFYEKDGKMLPGKKGLSLTTDQYASLLKAIPLINAALGEDGVEVDVPSGAEKIDAGPPKTTTVEKKQTKKKQSKKANFEATSEEDSD